MSFSSYFRIVICPLSALGDYISREALKRSLIRKVADEPRPLLHIDYVNYRAFARKALGDALSNALRPAGDGNHFVLEYHLSNPI